MLEKKKAKILIKRSPGMTTIENQGEEPAYVGFKPKIDRSKIGKASKKKGARAETESAKFWSNILGSDIRRTPRSGAFVSWPGDFIDMGKSILKDFVWDSKYGATAVPKKIEQEMKKLTDESQGKPHFLEINKPYQEPLVEKQEYFEPLIIIKRKYFARLLKQLQDYENESN